MRLAFPAILLAATFACAPPDLPPELSGDPVIEVAYPPDGAVVPLDDDGVLRLPVVVGVERFDFIPPGEGEGKIEGEGHWHLFFEPGGLMFMPDALFMELEIEDLEPGLRSIQAELHHHNHTPYECATCVDVVEIDVVDPEN